ncbi:hypothetical protein ACFYXV_30975 [Streptomyces sp. NPDC002181]|uniref:hypothetical protein n=1 Tax=Streptomyces sp. NPDC002181 TaxID=3364635 RepID=UPI003676B5D0
MTARMPFRGAATAALLTAVTVSSCTTGGSDEAGACEVRHELDQITSRFPSFRQLESTSWCGIDPDKPSRWLPSQNEIRLVGVLNAVDDQAVLKDLDNPELGFRTVVPENVPPEIAKLLPEQAEWMMSDRVNKDITEDLYSGSFYYDKRSGQVMFDCWNPMRKDGPAPVPTGN